MNPKFLVWIRTIVSLMLFGYLLFSLFNQFFVNDPAKMLVIALFNPYYAFIQQFYNSQTMIVILMVLLVLFAIFVMVKNTRGNVENE